jgi:four helix bundle protein
MNRNRVEDFGPYQDALQLFDGVVEDMAILQKDPRCYRLVGQQIGSADSISANIDEGFGRISRTEYIRFLDISRGSARETLGRYKRLKHWRPQETINERVALADRIIARLTRTIQTLKANNPPATRSTRHLSPSPDTRHVPPASRHSTLDTQHGDFR